MDPQHRAAHARLWTDLARRACPGYVAAPASLLAFTAWQAGDGALANLAIDRALTDDPAYSMALLLIRRSCRGHAAFGCPAANDAGRSRRQLRPPPRSHLTATGRRDTGRSPLANADLGPGAACAERPEMFLLETTKG